MGSTLPHNTHWSAWQYEKVCASTFHYFLTLVIGFTAEIQKAWSLVQLTFSEKGMDLNFLPKIYSF